MACKRKYVYLYELDSVCKTDEDIIIAQNALYNEVAVNGNIVVLSYNQIVDSRGFFSLWYNEKYNKGLLELFDKGVIKISQYGEIRTVAQYLINSIKPEKEFIYSGLPVKSSQTCLTSMMRRSLQNSDLSEIKYYIELADSDRQEDDEKVQELFIEVIDRKKYPPQIGKDKMRSVLKYMYSYIEMVLKLSMMPDIYIKPRNPEEYKNMKFINILRIVLGFNNDNNPLFDKAVAIINGLTATKTNENNRSVYFRDLDKVLKDNNRTECQYARAILDVIYNYACEISIANTSKHYIASELMDDNKDKRTFRVDFFNRLDYYWRNGVDSDARFRTDDNNDFVEFTRIKEIPDFERAARIAPNLKKK